MQYTLNLEHLSVQKYKGLFKQQNLLPIRKILWQCIDKKGHCLNAGNKMRPYPKRWERDIARRRRGGGERI